MRFGTFSAGGRRGAGSATASILATYDIDSVLAAIRADTSDGINFTAAATNALNGLQRPTPPNLSSPTLVTATSRADMVTHCANGSSNKIITWTPGTYTGGAAIPIGGQDLRIIVNGTEWTPNRDECAFIILGSARRVELTGNRSTWRNGFYCEDVCEDIHFIGLHLAALAEGAANPIRSFADETASAIAAYGHRVMASSCYFRMPGGTWYSGLAGGATTRSTNIIAINSILYTTTADNTPEWQLSNGRGPTWHENPSRFNHTDLALVVDCKVYADSKFCLRAHADCGRVGWIRNQLERGGWYTEPTPPGSASTSALRIRRNKLYRPSGLSSGGGLSIPYSGSPTPNTLLSLKETTYYNDGSDGTAGAALLPTGGGAPHASWSTCNDSTASLASGNTYELYTSTPAWDYRTATPTY